MRRLPLLAPSILLVALHSAAISGIVHVPADQPTIQAGIDAASSGDTVVVACGVYEECGILMKSGVHLTSETGNPECVTIDGLGLGRVLYCENVAEGATISGLTITGGRAVEEVSAPGRASSDSLTSGGPDAARPWWEPYCGAGLSCKSSEVHLEHVVFERNEADRGGGLALPWESLVTLSDVVFRGNTGGKYGGGIFSDFASELQMTGVVFEHNSTRHYGGGMYSRKTNTYIDDTLFYMNASGERGGGAMCQNELTHYQLLATDVTFIGNWATRTGGGLWCQRIYNSVLSALVFEDNGTDSGCGGGAYLWDCNPLLVDSFFSGNHTNSTGGGVCIHFAEPDFLRCTFVRNSALRSGAVDPYGYVSFTNCTFVENSATDKGAVTSTHYYGGVAFDRCILALSRGGQVVACALGETNIDMECTDVYGNEGGDWIDCIAGQAGVDGNLCADPLFCSDASPGEPYSLHADSPCSPEHSQNCGLIGAWGVACGATAVEHTTWGRTKALYR